MEGYHQPIHSLDSGCPDCPVQASSTDQTSSPDDGAQSLATNLSADQINGLQLPNNFMYDYEERSPNQATTPEEWLASWDDALTPIPIPGTGTARQDPPDSFYSEDDNIVHDMDPSPFLGTDNQKLISSDFTLQNLPIRDSSTGIMHTNLIAIDLSSSTQPARQDPLDDLYAIANSEDNNTTYNVDPSLAGTSNQQLTSSDSFVQDLLIRASSAGTMPTNAFETDFPFSTQQVRHSEDSKKPPRPHKPSRPSPYNKSTGRVKRDEAGNFGKCILCKEKKIKCSSDGLSPCHTCIQAAQQHDTIANRICYHDTEKGKETRLRILDFFELKGRNATTPYSCKQCGPKERQLKLIPPPIVTRDRSFHFRDHTLIVSVEQCVATEDLLPLLGISSWSVASTVVPDADAMNVILGKIAEEWKEVFPDDSSSITNHSLECFIQKLRRNYKIKESSLPTMENLVAWASQSRDKETESFPLDIESVLEAFLARYRDVSAPGQMQSLVEQILNLTSLGRFLDKRRPIDAEKFDYYKAQKVPDSHYRASSVPDQVRKQLFHLAATYHEQLETKILGYIDNLLPSSARIKPHFSDPLILGLCVRMLSLHYRRIMLRYKKFKEDMATRKRNPQDMYDAMARHYMRVFRGTLSPFHEDFQVVDRAEVLLHDEMLVKLFQRFKDAEAYHYHHELKREDDGVYMGLYAERKGKNHKSPSTSWASASNPALAGMNIRAQAV